VVVVMVVVMASVRVVVVVISGMSVRINCDFDLLVVWWRSGVVACYAFVPIGLWSNYSRN